MRFTLVGLLLTCAVSASAQTPTDTTPKPKKAPSKLGKIVKGLAEPAATAAAGAGVQAVLGKNASGVANALGATTPCGQAYGVTAGAAIVGTAKGIVKKAVDTTPAPPPCPQAGVAGLIPGMPAGIPGIPAGMPGMPGMPDAASVAAAMAGGAASSAAGTAVGGLLGGAAAGGAPGMGSLGAVAGYTPIGLAASAAPGAIKGIKGLMAGKSQDKLAMVRELGKGKLELKHVNFIEGTLEFEPGFEESFVAFAEAVALVEGTYLMHVSAEQSRQKGVDPDTVLSRKRVAKVWGLMAANGVSDQKVIAVTELPEAIKAGRKLPKAGDVKVEIIKYNKP